MSTVVAVNMEEAVAVAVAVVAAVLRKHNFTILLD